MELYRRHPLHAGNESYNVTFVFVYLSIYFILFLNILFCIIIIIYCFFSIYYLFCFIFVLFLIVLYFIDVRHK